MTTVVIHFESSESNVFSGRKVDLAMWRESLKILGVTKLYVVDTSDAEFEFIDDVIDIKVIKSLADAPKRGRVYCDPRGEISIKDFKHPKNAVYIFGSDSVGLELKDLSKAVCIPSVNEYKESWAVCAANIILYDRTL